MQNEQAMKDVDCEFNICFDRFVALEKSKVNVEQRERAARDDDDEFLHSSRSCHSIFIA